QASTAKRVGKLLYQGIVTADALPAHEVYLANFAQRPRANFNAVITLRSLRLCAQLHLISCKIVSTCARMFACTASLDWDPSTTRMRSGRRCASARKPARTLA